jgi:hypothetical protein
VLEGLDGALSGCILGYGRTDPYTIPVIQKDRFPTISPAYDMLDRAVILNTYLARHQSILPLKMHGGRRKTGQIYVLTPFP